MSFKIKKERENRAVNVRWTFKCNVVLFFYFLVHFVLAQDHVSVHHDRKITSMLQPLSHGFQVLGSIFYL